MSSRGGNHGATSRGSLSEICRLFRCTKLKARAPASTPAQFVAPPSMFRRTKKLSTSPTGFGLTRALTRVRVDRVDHGLDLNKSAVFEVELGEVAGRGIDAVCADERLVGGGHRHKCCHHGFFARPSSGTPRVLCTILNKIEFLAPRSQKKKSLCVLVLARNV